jgi:hypothetical protein
MGGAMMRRAYLLWAAWPAICLAETVSTPVRASDDVAHMTWADLVQRANDSMARGDPRGALGWAQKAADIHMSLSLRKFMLDAQRAVGDAAAAYTTARMCVTEAEADPKPPKRDEILSTCRDAVVALAPSLGQLSVTLPSTLPPGLKVSVSGVELLPALLALPYPVNPGLATVDVSAPGYAAFHEAVTVNAANTAAITVTLKPEVTKCSSGKVMGPDQRTCITLCRVGQTYTTDGEHCCWPGQAWSAEAASCTGTPECPEGLVVQGKECAASPPPLPLPLPPVTQVRSSRLRVRPPGSSATRSTRR